MSIRPTALMFAGLLITCAAPKAAAITPKMDFNNDGYGDLAIGAPLATVNGKLYAGSVTVLYGSASNFNTPFATPIAPQLTSQNAQVWTKALASVPGEAEVYDQFGSALAAGDFNADGYTDLAIGVPAPGGNRPGSVIVLYGSANGLVGSHYCYPSPCVPNPQMLKMPLPHPGDEFGHALAAGHFNQGMRDDLAVGAPHYNLIGVPNAGAVRVFYGTASGFSDDSDLLLSLKSLAGEPQIGDQFGYALAAGNFDGGPADTVDLAIGIPFKGTNGAVSVVYGTIHGLSAVQAAWGGGSKLWTPSITNFPSSGNGDWFGFSLAAGNLGRGSSDDLAIGMPGRDIGDLTSAGAVMILYGQESGLYGATHGLTTAGSQLWTFNSPDVVGSPGSGDFLGRELAAGNLGYDGYADLAIGIPSRDPAGLTDAGAVVILYGAASGVTGANSRYLTMGSQAQEWDRFGESLSVAKFGGDSYRDLAVGIPQLSAPGAVRVYFGSGTGPGAAANQHWTPAGIGVPDGPGYGSKFGSGLSK
jgi:hypothetical protein